LNPLFENLEDEKKRRIINAALEVFSKQDYKHATTDQIVHIAGISKGSLFQYFKNKKTLYLDLYSYCYDIVKKEMNSKFNDNATDLFEILVQTQELKYNIMKNHPDLFLFLLKAYSEEHADVINSLKSYNNSVMDRSIDMLIKRADTSKFKADVDIDKAIKIIFWCSEGFMREALEKGDSLDQINEEFLIYLELLKYSFYKNEFL